MKQIGRKQSSDNAAWFDAMANIETLVSEKDYRAAEKQAIASIKKTCKGKKAALAYSGGKDSIILAHLCQQAGVKDSMMGLSDLEYPAFEAWVQEHKPEGCQILRSAQDLAWLAKHPEMLFPATSAHTGRWFAIVQHKAQEDYYRQQGLDLLILGRRRADGNHTGPEGIYTNGRGITRYSPLYAWPHEMVLAGIHYNQLALPPIYAWKDGYTQGTHPWPARARMADSAQGWQEIFDIDPAIVHQAATVIDSAKAFLEGVGA